MKLITVITSNMFLDLTSREKQENQGGGFTPKERILNVDLKLGQRVVSLITLETLLETLSRD